MFTLVQFEIYCPNWLIVTLIFPTHIFLQSSSGDLAIKKARKNPNQYVIKPQREGGGG